MVDFKHAEIRKKFGAGRGVINQRLFAEKLCNTLIAADNDDSEAQQLLDYMYTHVSQVTRAKNHKEFSASEINSIQKLKLLAPNSTQFFDSVAHEIFAHKKYHYSKRRFTPILLSGEPGVGKTFATQLLADHLNIDHGKIQVSTMNSGFEFSGLSTKWKTPTLGYLLKILITFESHTGIIILDELDKFSASREHGSLYDALLYLLEEDTCDSLVNELFELPLHTKDVLWVATANNLNKIPEPVLSRFKIIHINNLTKDQAIKITDNIYRKLSEKWKKFGYETAKIGEPEYSSKLSACGDFFELNSIL